VGRGQALHAPPAVKGRRHEHRKARILQCTKKGQGSLADELARLRLVGVTPNAFRPGSERLIFLLYYPSLAVAAGAVLRARR
jgi:hypothetical protein